jgi:hypothetical protein
VLIPEELRAALHHTPCLECLALRYCTHCVDNTLIDALHYKGSLMPLVPHLRCLVQELILLEGSLTDIMASMIAPRWWRKGIPLEVKEVI